MSKLKSALLLRVALSPIFVSATRGIEVVHAEVVQNAVAQQVKKATEVKPVKGTDEKKTDDKKVDTVTAASQGDSDIDNTRSEKSNIIAFSDKDFLKKFKATNYYQQQVAMYGENKPGSDAALAAQGASYLSSIIGEAFIKVESKPTIMKALGFAGPIGALLSCMIDWLTPAARNKTEEKLNEISNKLDALGIHLDNVGSAIADKIDEATTESKLEAFRTQLEKTRGPFGTVAGEISQYQAGHNITLASKDKNDVQTYVDEYAKLYRTTEWGFDDKSQKVAAVPNSENLTVFNNLCGFGGKIVSGDINQNNIFRVMSNYESFKEFFNTQTFATREAFADYVMSHYTVWASDMMTAIFFDYFRVKGQLDLITASDEYKESVTAAKTNGTTVDDEFKKSCPISYTLFNNLRSNARNDLMRLGYDVMSDKGHNDSYELDEYDKNQWVDKYNNESVYVTGLSQTNILGANVNAVNYAYAKEIENKPVKTLTSAVPNPKYADYLKQSESFKKEIKHKEQEIEDLKRARDKIESDFNSNYPAVAKTGDKEKIELFCIQHELDLMSNKDARERVVAQKCNIDSDQADFERKAKENGDNNPEILSYAEKCITDDTGNPLQSKLQTEEKTSNDGKMLYSYRNNKWVYSQLVSGQAAYAAKHMVEKNDLQSIKDMCDTSTEHAGNYFQTCWEHNEDLPKNPNWDAAFENVMLKSDVESLNTNATLRHRGGINSLLANTVTRKVNDIEMLGFKGLGEKNRIIGDKDYNFTGKGAGLYYSPTFNIGLGCYENDKHVDPSDKQKTVYQDFKFEGTYTKFNKDGSVNYTLQAYHEKSYDQGDVTFIKLVKDGDSELGALNNGNKTPVAPEHFVQ
ncbi:hypothetical protein [Leuconostoc pseudomesenteroides]|uniref:hypothetical protein n=1 Tax=Leuconostoc pseudomesenteroides TaxID=33968 RepID=UPI0039EAF159